MRLSILSLQVTGGRLVEADIAVKTFEFRVVAVYVPYCVGERRFFFPTVGAVPQRFATVLMGDWNAILDPKLDRGRRGARGSDRCESSLVDLLAEHDLVDKFRLDHQGREM